MSNDPQRLSKEALSKFLQVFRYLRRYSRHMSSQGIHPRQFSVLLFLLETGPVTVGQVQEYLYQSPSTTSTLIAKMEKAGYVTRTRSKEDNRVVIVELTAAGRDVVQRTPPGGIALLRRRFDTLSPERLQRIDAALADIMELMEVPEEK